MTLNATWGYSHRDHNFKSPATVIENMVQIAGKGGNLLLNVGPDALGNIPEESDHILCEVGKWLRINGESIYRTSNIPNFPYLLRWGDLTYNKEQMTLYFHVKKYPKFPYRILLTGLKTKVESAKLLASGESLKIAQSYEPARDEHRFYVFLPEICPDPDDTVVAVKLSGEAEAQRI